MLIFRQLGVILENIENQPRSCATDKNGWSERGQFKVGIQNYIVHDLILFTPPEAEILEILEIKTEHSYRHVVHNKSWKSIAIASSAKQHISKIYRISRSGRII